MLHPYPHPINTSKEHIPTDNTLLLVWDTPSTWIEISKSAFEHNVAHYKKVIGQAVNLAVVVKSNAYGHGIVDIGALCQQSSAVDWLCTTSLSEALVLRQHGVTKPIVVTCLIDIDPRHALEHNIDLVAFDMETIRALHACAQKLKKIVNVHIKIDTGMSRFGAYPEQALTLIKQVLLLPFVRINGICSHFSESDAQDASYTHEQLAHFNAVLAELERENIHIPIKHIGNSAAVISNQQSHFNLVRVGAAAYGLMPSLHSIAQIQQQFPDFSLKPVMAWKTKIINLRTIPAHTPIGYNRTYVTEQAATIALLPIGYYEGYDRRLTNKGTVVVATHNMVKVHEHYAPVVGRVCMNVTMIDVTHIKDVKPGDEVLLLGNSAHLQAHEIAATIGSFNPREITTRISPTIVRKIIE
jgi:alanine racemase